MGPDPRLMFELIKNKQIAFCPLPRQKRGQNWVRISISHPGTALVGGGEKNLGKKTGVGSFSSSGGPGPGMWEVFQDVESKKRKKELETVMTLNLQNCVQ